MNEVDKLIIGDTYDRDNRIERSFNMAKDKEHITQTGLRFTIEPVPSDRKYTNQDMEVMAKEVLNTGMNPQLVSDLKEEEIQAIWAIINGRHYTQ